MEERLVEQGYMSVIRICDDVVRQEYKNIALILVNEQGTIGYMLRLADDDMPEKYQNSSFLSGWLDALMERIKTNPLSLAELVSLSKALWNTLCIAPPNPVAVLDGDWNKTLAILWNSHVAPKGQELKV